MAVYCLVFTGSSSILTTRNWLWKLIVSYVKTILMEVCKPQTVVIIILVVFSLCCLLAYATQLTWAVKSKEIKISTSRRFDVSHNIL